MKFQIENLGRLDKAELEVADLTVICGENSTGKTYATYAFYGFLRMWANGPMSPHPVALSAAHALPQTGVQRVDLIKDLLPNAQAYFDEMSALYNSQLAKVFASREDYFTDSAIHFTPDDIVPDVSPEYTHTVKVGSATALIFFKEEGSSLLEITRPSGLNKTIPVFAVANLIDEVFRKLVWSQIVPEVFISSTERTGAAVFQRSLNFARDKALNALTQMEANRQQNDPQVFVTQLFVDYQADYPLPVEDNVRLLGNLEQISKSTGKIASNHPEILKAFDAIVGGSYKSTKEGVYYIPKGSKNKLTMSESSSVVRSLGCVNK
jgi:AAA ATPase domain